MSDPLVHASKFEALIARLFERMGTTTVEEKQVGRDRGYDLRIRAKDGGVEALVGRCCRTRAEVESTPFPLGSDDARDLGPSQG